MRRFANTRLAKMSSGHYCVIRDLGLVKGGKGLRHHEVALDLTLRGAFKFARSLFSMQADWPQESDQEASREPALARPSSRN